MVGVWQGQLTDALSNFSLPVAMELSTAIRRAEEDGHELTAIEEVLWRRLTSKIKQARESQSLVAD